MPKTIPCPFKIIVDTREQKPWKFEGLTKRVRGEDRPIEVETVRRKLESGDYSIEGMENQIAIERKSASDLISTVFHGRDRFVRELERLSQLKWAAVVVEGEWESTLQKCARETKANPVSLDSSIIAWQLRYSVHFVWRPQRWMAEKTAFKILDRYWRDNE